MITTRLSGGKTVLKNHEGHEPRRKYCVPHPLSNLLSRDVKRRFTQALKKVQSGILSNHIESEEVIMENLEGTKTPRTQIAIRLVLTILCLVIFEILKVVVQVTVLFQYVYLLITQKYNEPLRNFSNKVATYAYKIIRYATLNDNHRPFPFNDFPTEMERPEEPVTFGKEF